MELLLEKLDLQLFGSTYFETQRTKWERELTC